MSTEYTNQAINSVLNSELGFCKFLSANDTGATGGHQSGILVSKSALLMMFTNEQLMLNDFFRVWDTPGLGDGVENDRVHKKKMTDLLYKTYTYEDQLYGFIDLVMVVVEGSNRDMGTTYTLLNDVIVPNIQRERILVLINQADAAMKGRHWDYLSQRPDPVLMEFLEDQAVSIQKRVREATGITLVKPVYYSAEYGWNVDKVLDLIVDHMPRERRKLM